MNSDSSTTATGKDVRPVAPPPRGALEGWLGIVVVIVLLAIAGYTTYSTFTAVQPVSTTQQSVDLVCAKSGKHFRHEVSTGEQYPIMSPYTHERTGWPAERCYWTKDGNAKLEPTYVLLNETIGKTGPTLCPDCGRLVEPHNPLPPWDKMETARKAARGGSSSAPAPQ